MTILYKVATLSDPIGADAELAVLRHGWAVMRVRPNFTDHGQVLWADLLSALGHEANSSLQGRAGSHSQAIAFCWLAADAVQDVVIAGAHLLTPKALTELCSLTTAVGVRTWLVYDIETTDERERTEHGLGITTVDLGEFLERRRRAGEASPVVRPQPFPPVPDVPFVGFLDACTAVLSTNDLARVQALFAAARERMRSLLSTATDLDEHHVALFLHQVTADTNDLNELAVQVKGAQAGAFSSGWLIRVDVPRWAQRGMVAGLSLHLSEADWLELAKLHRPHEAATCVFSTLGLSVDAIPAVDAADVADDGSSVLKNGQPMEVPPTARRLLVAQHLYRHLVGADTDRFLIQGPKEPEVTEKWVGRLLRVVTRDTGVVPRGWNASRQSIDGTGWTHRLGVSVTRLAA